MIDSLPRNIRDGREYLKCSYSESRPRNSRTKKNCPTLIKQLEHYRRWANPGLVRILRESEPTSRDVISHASLALLILDPSQVNFLYDRMLTASPSELPVLRDALKPHSSQLAPKLVGLSSLRRNRDAAPLLPAAGERPALYRP